MVKEPLKNNLVDQSGKYFISPTLKILGMTKIRFSKKEFQFFENGVWIDIHAYPRGTMLRELMQDLINACLFHYSWGEDEEVLCKDV